MTIQNKAVDSGVGIRIDKIRKHILSEKSIHVVVDDEYGTNR